MNEAEAIRDLLKEWVSDQQPRRSGSLLPPNPYATVPVPMPAKLRHRKGEMKIEIERIANGWLITGAGSPSPGDPLLQCGPNGRHFADTPEAICGMIAEWVLAECKRQEEPR